MNMKYAMRSEDTEQINVVSWANWNVNRYPELRWLFHVPNGGSRNKQEAVKFKQMGVKAGVSDLCLPYPKGIYCGLFIEMKYGNNRQQDTQKEFLANMAAAGHFVATCYSAEEAIKVIEEYLNLALCYCPEEDFNNKMSIPNNSILKDGKGIFINESRTAAEAEFIKTHIVDYEKIFDVCMNGDDLEFKKGLVRLQKMQNEYVMQREND